MTGRGGGTGKGRGKGTPNLRTQRLGQTLDRLVPDESLIKLLWRLAQEGDSRCATYLADRKWGRPQTREQADDVPIRLVVGLPLKYPGMERSGTGE